LCNNKLSLWAPNTIDTEQEISIALGNQKIKPQY